MQVLIPLSRYHHFCQVVSFRYQNRTSCTLPSTHPDRSTHSAKTTPRDMMGGGVLEQLFFPPLAISPPDPISSPSAPRGTLFSSAGPRPDLPVIIAAAPAGLMRLGRCKLSQSAVCWTRTHSPEREKKEYPNEVIRPRTNQSHHQPRRKEEGRGRILGHRDREKVRGHHAATLPYPTVYIVYVL